MSLCLSKGLGAPIGSVLVGESRFIRKARHFRKLFGGGWRQAGMLASAGLHAIEHHWEAMREDHRCALRLARGLESLGFAMAMPCETNMVWADSRPVGVSWDALADALLSRAGIVVTAGPAGVGRLVTHHQVSTDACIDQLLATAAEQIKI
ncbi:Threonine aldolase [Dinochytrium kinnereticum]|nr:Threonine aldolase [Dinochytrium kinnereticum]